MTDDERVMTALREQGEELQAQTRMLREIRELLAGTGAAARHCRDARLTVVFAHYPAFARDYDWLVSQGYLTGTAEGLVIWNKSKQSLAEYFGNQEPRGRRHHWRDLENLFQVRGLKNSLSRNGDIFKKPSKDYEELARRLAARSRDTPGGT